jgi:hypothetical protein
MSGRGLSSHALGAVALAACCLTPLPARGQVAQDDTQRREPGPSDDEAAFRDAALAPFFAWCGVEPDDPAAGVARVDWAMLRALGFSPSQLEATARVPMGHCRAPSFRSFVLSSGRIPDEPAVPGTWSDDVQAVALAPGMTVVLDRHVRKHTVLIYPGGLGVRLSSTLLPLGTNLGASDAPVSWGLGARVEGYAYRGAIVRATFAGNLPSTRDVDDIPVSREVEYELTIGIPLTPIDTPHMGPPPNATRWEASPAAAGAAPGHGSREPTPVIHSLALAVGHRGSFLLNEDWSSALYYPSFSLGLMLRLEQNEQVTYRLGRGLLAATIGEVRTRRRYENLTLTVGGRFCPVGPRAGGLVDLQLMRTVFHRQLLIVGPISLRTGIVFEAGQAFSFPRLRDLLESLPARAPYVSATLTVGISTSMLPPWPEPRPDSGGAP